MFVDDDDKRDYLSNLRTLAHANNVTLHAYALMPSQVHMLITASESGGISRLIQMLGRIYVRRFNIKHVRSGTLWNGRFQACAVQSGSAALEVVRYVEASAVRAGIVTQAKDYEWSSYKHHAGISTSPLITDETLLWALGNTPFERDAAYCEIAKDALEPSRCNHIARSVLAGIPIGCVDFLSDLELQAGRSLTRKKRGRPIKV